MRSSTLIAAFLSLIGSVTADEHHNCGCTINGKYDTTLSGNACQLWANSGKPHTNFDGYSCVDPKFGRGIDGDEWEENCETTYDVTINGIDEVRGDCWH
ncbi:hypothetical protein J3E72DRAFT_370788 [Bipolaris maydis]|uniref:uncharacterized protein n=1 Tax=Cochliobolus heterostrophus TaxID=5016 RepID=UPI0024D68DB9|nr:hypothetical protein BM1_10697 [Bipolaris maydis]KAJ5031615.1 hypothetical protein J3E73DRAFT_364694 [Bipolaris maydis]KAJ5060338.1 hypothetical protein J3E74DRAFT_406693 [Bipolaris maydis]KAJ6201826.1 hypothetical protein J3E72DRAFT_370788 [Bipolaris maydis]KAJ6211141.1 hypothetical protein PSV09DRAFT_2398090 [Bipolaris maydis]